MKSQIDRQRTVEALERLKARALSGAFDSDGDIYDDGALEYASELETMIRALATQSPDATLEALASDLAAPLIYKKG